MNFRATIVAVAAAWSTAAAQSPGNAPVAIRCAQLQAAPWPAALGNDSIFHRLPSVVTLDTAKPNRPMARGTMYRLSPDMAYPHGNRREFTPQWGQQGDTLVLMWSNGFSPTVVRLTPRGKQLTGDAVAQTDSHPVNEPPRPRVRVTLRWRKCDGQISPT